MGFLDKNRDNLPIDVISVLATSENSFIANLFKQDDADNSQKKTKLTMAAQFKVKKRFIQLRN